MAIPVDDALEEVAIPPPRAQGDALFAAIASLPVSKQRLASKTPPTHSALSAKLNNNVLKQIASIMATVDDASVRFFGDVDRAMESSPYVKMISVLPTGVNRVFAKSFQSVFHSVVRTAV